MTICLLSADAAPEITRPRHGQLALVTILAVFGCSASPAADEGFETGPCVEGECFDGLMCLSNLCVGDAGGTGGDGGNGGDPGGGPGHGGGAGGGDGNADDGNADDGNADDGNADDGNADDGNAGDGNADDDSADDGNADDSADSADSADSEDGGLACEDQPGVPLGSLCSPLAQDCVPCAKCTPAGSTFEDPLCVGLNSDPASVGESCTVIDGPGSGIDNCEAGAMCWGVDADSQGGVCVELCSGSAQAPSCTTDGTNCALFNDDALPLCLPACDPLGQDCPAGDACYFVFEEPVCVVVVGGGGSGDTCNSVNNCDPGFACVFGGGDCQSASACCGAWCDVEADTPCDGGQECNGAIDGIGVCVGS